MDMATVDKLLTTTRSVRRRLDFEREVPRQLITECLELALQAPTGTNLQQWHFMVVQRADLRQKIADYYRRSFEQYVADPASLFTNPKDEQMERVADSSRYLSENMHRVPIMIIPCYRGRVEQSPPMRQASLYGSLLPAAWSLMLALRSRGLGAAWTTIHVRYEKDIAALLNIPDDVTQGVLLPVAYYTGDDFQPAQRTPLNQVMSWDEWTARD